MLSFQQRKGLQNTRNTYFEFLIPNLHEKTNRKKKIRQSQNSKKNIMYQKKVTILHYLAQMFNIYVVIMTETINTFLAKAFLEV